MYSSDRKVMPPLWLWCLLFSFTALITFVVKEISDLRLAKEFSFISSYIEAHNKSAKDKHQIVFIGTSLTRNGLESSSVIENELRKNANIEVDVVKIWRPATSMEKIVEQVPELNRIHPALLIVEANMFCYTRERKSFFAEMPVTINDLLHNKTLKPYDPEEKPDETAVRQFVIGQKRTGVVDTSSIRSFRELAERMQANGTKIILLNYPYDAEQEMKKWRSSDTSLFNRNLKYISQKINFEYFNPRKNWDSSYYLDGAHMNQKGCAAFTKWLCDTLSVELKK